MAHGSSFSLMSGPYESAETWNAQSPISTPFSYLICAFKELTFRSIVAAHTPAPNVCVHGQIEKLFSFSTPRYGRFWQGTAVHWTSLTPGIRKLNCVAMISRQKRHNAIKMLLEGMSLSVLTTRVRWGCSAYPISEIEINSSINQPLMCILRVCIVFWTLSIPAALLKLFHATRTSCTIYQVLTTHIF